MVVAGAGTVSFTTGGVAGTSYLDTTGRWVGPGISITTANGVSSTNGYFTGNVGIGTTLPSFPLAFGPSLGNKIALYNNGSAVTYGFGIQNHLLQIFANTSTDRVGIGYGDSASFTETLTVKGSNVGIETTTPSERLDLGGGNIKMGYEMKGCTFAAGASGWQSCVCTAGKQVLGASCRASSSGTPIGLI